MQFNRSPTPLSRLAAYNPNRAGMHRGGLGALGALGASSNQVLSGTPDQIAATIASAMVVPVPSSMTMPDGATLAAAVDTIVSNVPQVPVQENLQIPQKTGNTYTALSGIGHSYYYSGRHGLGALNPVSLASQGAGVAASSLAIGAGLGSFAGPIGAAVGAIVGIIAGLFGKKQVSPPTTQAQITAAQNFIAQYKQIAGTVIGRAYPTSSVQDMAMAFCINADVAYNNAGGCGNQAGIANTWNEQLARLNAFFTAMQNTAVGDTVVLRDIPSLPGHGNTNMNVAFTFPNPGVQAPNYILGPYYAQYFYTMCNIFQDSANCSGLQLTAPVPQFYCDLIDWYRAQHPAWDIPAGTIDAPVEYVNLSLAPGQVNTPAATPTVPALTLAANVSPNETGASLTINANGTATETGGTVSTALSTSNPILQAGATSPLSATSSSAANTGVLTAAVGDDTLFGFTPVELGLLAAVLVVVLGGLE